jgi:hypothetical protein
MDVRKLKNTLFKRTALVFVGVVFLFAVSFSMTIPSSSYAQPAPQATSQDDATTEDATETGTNCAIEKIGWILCPVIEGSAKLADFAFRFLANNFLAIEAELLSSQDPNTGTFAAWGEARNLANILFVIAFVIIVYSQITGSGLNNYGIKRMLPRLILAAIAVNVSYYICQALADISNILGYNIMQMLQATADRIGPRVMGPDVAAGPNLSTTSGGGIVATIALAALPLAGIIWLLLPVLGSIVLFIVVTCVTIILILLLRKAFIVLLVVISPLAFVMYLLPNTEKYFSKWLDMFWKLLLVFPIVSLLMGGGQLASTIILVAGSQDAPAQGQPVQCDTSGTNGKDATSANIQTDSFGIDGECPIIVGNKQSSMTLGLVAAGIAVAPLLAVWSVLQGALAAAGAIGGKIGGAVNSIQGKQRGKLGKSMAENNERRRNQINAAAISGDTRLGRALNRASLGSARRGAARRAKGNYAKSAMHNAEIDYISRKALDENDELTGFGKSLAGGVLASEQQRDKVRSNALNAQNSLQNEEIKAASVRAETMADDKLVGQVKTLDGSNMNSPEISAAINELAKRQNFEGLQQAIEKIADHGNGKSSLVSRSVASAMSQNGGGLLTSSQLGDISRGDVSSGAYQKFANENLENGILSPEKMAESGPGLLKEASRVANVSGSLDAMQQLVNSANSAYNDDVLNKKISRNAKVINSFRAGKDANDVNFKPRS